MLRDCYVSFDREAGRVLIGNSTVEKVGRIEKSCVATERVTDKINGAMWSGDELCLQRCPVLEEDEEPVVSLHTEEVTACYGMLPHLKAVLELSGKNGTVWYEYTVFPEIPFVYTQAFVEKRGGAVETLAAITAVYRHYAAELFGAYCLPIGDVPNGMHFTGYCCKNADGKTGHLLLFREETQANGHTFPLPVSLKGAKLRTLYQSAPVETVCEACSVTAVFSAVRSVIWLRYEAP